MSKIKVVYRKKPMKYKGKAVWGLAHAAKNSIEVDSSLRGKKLIEILLHEVVHLKMPEATEEQVEQLAAAQTQVLWDQVFSKMDNSDPKPLQTGEI